MVRRAPRFDIVYMDRSVAPSADFYRYATGRWIDHHPIPADKSRWAAFDELSEYNFQRLRQILERAARPRAGRSPVEREVGDFYAAIMDRHRRNQLGVSPLRYDLGLVEEVRNPETLAGVLGTLHDRGISSLFQPYVQADKKDSKHYALYLEQGGLSLPDRDYYLAPAFARQRREFLGHVESLLVLAGHPRPAARRSARRILALETKLARASRTRAALQDERKNYHRMTVSGLRSLAPALPWRTYLRARRAAGLRRVVVGQPEFFRSLSRLLRGRPVSEWKDYLRWQVIRSGAPYLSDAFEDEFFRFNLRVLTGQARPEPPWKRAARTVDRAVGEALGRLFVEAHFPPSSAERMRRLVNDIRVVFRRRLAGLDWMSPATRRQAALKFRSFRAKIGHPRRYRDDSKLRIRRDDCLGNIRRAAEHESRRRMAEVGRRVNKDRWRMTPPTVNAYFEATQNQILFPAGILQPPFFDPSQDDAVNYGAIGLVIGHEITHGYDDQGRLFDRHGNLRDWWTARDGREFRRRARAVVKQYDQFEILPGLRVNGALTVSENIADLGGLSIAYEALQRRLRRSGGSPKRIDGLTPEQRFFISFAQIWRQNSRPAFDRLLATVDTHSPARVRVLGSVQNSDGFFDNFAIRPGSPMWRPPSARIHIW